MFIVFTQHISSRFEYIVKTLLGANTVITRDINKFSNTSLQKINYSTTRFDKESLWIQPFGLLEETAIRNIHIECSQWNELPIFFETQGTLPFDIFSASFYLISRYEEYTQDFISDDYGNYHHSNSIAYKNNFLQIPLINLWIREIEKQFQLTIHHSIFTITPTYDIDIAFAYKHHSLIRTLGGVLRESIQLKRTSIERAKVILGIEKDPFDVFDWLDKQHRKFKLKPKYFFLLAKKRGVYDKNSKPNTKAFNKLIKQQALNYEVGIHPSFASNYSDAVLQKEINILHKIINKDVRISRQHYLQLKFPATYNKLISAGIKDDFTLGYGTHNGFRASYCLPFFWYNLAEEKTTALCLHPFCYMDANSIFEQKLDNTRALNEMLYYRDIIKKVKGNFIYIMHNHFLAHQPQWQLWKEVYEEFLNQISD